MAFPPGSPVIDTMIGFPHEGFAQYDFIRRQTRDRSSQEEMEFPVEYMFKDVPKDLPTDDPDRGDPGRDGQVRDRARADRRGRRDLAGRAQGPPGPLHPVRRGAGPERRHRQRARASGGSTRQYGIRATSVFPAGTFPQVPIDDPKMYPIYQTCVDLGIPDLRAAPASRVRG